MKVEYVRSDFIAIDDLPVIAASVNNHYGYVSLSLKIGEAERLYDALDAALADAPRPQE